MINRWFGSDHHFFHKRIREICPDTRKGDSLEEMHELLIEKHNSLVKPDDIVWFLGDFSFGTSKKTLEILRRLNGKLNLIRGNHDHWLSTETRALLDEVYDYNMLKFDGRFTVLCHYPMARFDRMQYGGFHLHGHTHGDYSVEGRILDVGVDARPQKDMGLWHWDDIVTHMEPLKYTGHHKDRIKIEL